MPDWVIPLAVGLVAQFVAIGLFFTGQNWQKRHRHDESLRQLCGRLTGSVFILIRLPPSGSGTAVGRKLLDIRDLIQAVAELQTTAPRWLLRQGVEPVLERSVELMSRSQDPELRDFAAAARNWLAEIPEEIRRMSDTELRQDLSVRSAHLIGAVREYFGASDREPR